MSMIYKTSELTGGLLDAAVQQAWGEPTEDDLWMFGVSFFNEIRPSSSWLHGGPIIDQNDIQLGGYGTSRQAEIRDDSKPWVSQWGETSLIAAMRCFVAHKLGDEVEL